MNEWLDAWRTLMTSLVLGNYLFTAFVFLYVVKALHTMRSNHLAHIHRAIDRLRARHNLPPEDWHGE